MNASLFKMKILAVMNNIFLSEHKSVSLFVNLFNKVVFIFVNFFQDLYGR